MVPVSADPDLEASTVNDDIPQSGTRSTSYYAKRIHRQHPDTSEPPSACGEMHRDADYKECHPPKLLSFQRWTLCDNPECFGSSSFSSAWPVRYPVQKHRLQRPNNECQREH